MLNYDLVYDQLIFLSNETQFDDQRIFDAYSKCIEEVIAQTIILIFNLLTTCNELVQDWIRLLKVIKMSTYLSKELLFVVRGDG